MSSAANPSMIATAARLAVDIGGTFTDLALEHGGTLRTAKVLTTPAAPELGMLDGIGSILSAGGLAPADLRLVVHGTTLATNALIERRGARTALLTTAGFRDVLALGHESRYDQYDLDIVLPTPLVPRDLRLPVPERLDNEGGVLRALDEAAVRALVPLLRREAVESVAVGFLHAFVNPAHERRVRDILAEMMPDLPVCLSSDVSPEMREYERFSTTAANAYIQPLMRGYLTRLAAALTAMGIEAPLLLMLSGGGLTDIDTACRLPIRLVESGPAGGAIFAAGIARRHRIDRALSFDMGGTTAKICLVDEATPRTARQFEVARVGRFQKGSGLPLRIPVIEMVEIGAGGGSLAQVDALGRLEVGPQSAGADPGPACYARGGERAAVTDANLVLGRYDPSNFAGGALRLDPAAAAAALTRDVGQPLGLEPGMAALGVVEIVDENMARAARVHTVETGAVEAGRAMIAFGGGGPVHAYRVAEKIGTTRIVIPVGAGVGSAIGFLRAPIAYETVRTQYQRIARFDVRAVNSLLAAMTAESRDVVAAAASGGDVVEQRSAFMRYVGQGHEITVTLPAEPLGDDAAAGLRAAYDLEYARLYTRPVPASDVEVLGYAVRVAIVTAAEQTLAEAPATRPVMPIAWREVRDAADGETSRWAVFARADLPPGATLDGPAIITETETATLVGPAWRAAVAADASLVLERRA